MEWKREILVAHMVKQKVSEVDVAALWDYPYPEVAATESDVGSAEKALGHSLNLRHREFLRHANGWKSFFQSVDVFDTNDLVGGPRYNRALELLQSCEGLHELCGFTIDELLPIAVSADDLDVFAISKETSHSPGVVYWFAGQLIDEFPSFDEWFLSMVDYSRREYARMSEERSNSI